MLEDVVKFDVRNISYKDYLELWECFLEGRQYKDQNIMIDVSSLKQDVHRAIYDELILAILKVANKLDLSSFRDVTSKDVSITVGASQSILPCYVNFYTIINFFRNCCFHRIE